MVVLEKQLRVLILRIGWGGAQWAWCGLLKPQSPPLQQHCSNKATPPKLFKHFTNWGLSLWGGGILTQTTKPPFRNVMPWDNLGSSEKPRLSEQGRRPLGGCQPPPPSQALLCLRTNWILINKLLSLVI